MYRLPARLVLGLALGRPPSAVAWSRAIRHRRLHQQLSHARLAGERLPSHADRNRPRPRSVSGADRVLCHPRCRPATRADSRLVVQPEPRRRADLRYRSHRIPHHLAREVPLRDPRRQPQQCKCRPRRSLQRPCRDFSRRLRRSGSRRAAGMEVAVRNSVDPGLCACLCGFVRDYCGGTRRVRCSGAHAAAAARKDADSVSARAGKSRHTRFGEEDMIAGLRRVLLALGVIGVIGVAGFFGWRWYDRSRDIQVTDDAYVRGEITNIGSRVTGYAVEVLVDDNMPVNAAQVIARIDPRDFRMNVEKSEAALAQAKAGLAQIGAQRELENSKIVVAEAALRSAQAQTKNAEIVLQRATTLAERNFATQASVDADTAAAAQARSAVDQAAANIAFEREQLVVIDSNEAVARAQVASAEAALLAAKFALDDTEIWAPIDGVVANRKTRVGEYVTAGTRMLSVVPIDNMWIEANYRETQLGRMKIGDPVRVDAD